MFTPVFRLLLIAGLLVLPVWSQQNTGSVTGMVRDPSGAVIVGAAVRLDNAATGAVTNTVSNETGAFVFPNLGVGTYKLTVTAPGFNSVEQSNIRVISGVTVTLDSTLPVGQTSEITTVTGELSPIDTNSSNSGTTRVTEEIRDLPLSIAGGARNSLGWMRTVPGIQWDPTAGGFADIITTETAVIQGVGIGLFTGGASYNIDGISAMGNKYQPLREDSGPIPEVIEEFRVASNLNAESGWNLGSSIELVMKSGANSLHAQLFEYFRNDLLDARNFFAATRDVEKQNEFGGVISGPVIRNRLFFIGSYDGFRYHTAAAGTVATVPTEAMRQGNFSAFLGSQIGTDSLGRPVYQGQIFDPLTTRSDGQGGFIRDPFPGNTIPSDRLGKFSSLFQQGYPLPNRPGTANNWVGFPSPSPTVQDKMTLKFDATLAAHRLSFGTDHIFRKNQIYGNVFAPEIRSNYEVQTTQYRYRVSETWVMRPNLVLDVRAGFVRFPRDIGDKDLPNGNYGAKVGFPGVYTPDTPSVSIQGVTGFGSPFRRIHDPGMNAPIKTDLVWIKGSHNFKIGVEFEQQAALRVLEQGGQGSFSFAPAQTGMPNFPLSGNAYASYLLGGVSSGSITTPVANRTASRSWGLFIQDQWRATKRLTVNYGLRWDYNSPITETYDRLGTFDPRTPNPKAGGLLGGLTFWGNGPGRNGRHQFLEPYYRAFGPRLGLAYALHPGTVVRAYYGIAYNILSSDSVSLSTPLSYGWNASASRASQDGFTPAFNFNDGFPPIVPALPALDPSFLNGSSLLYFEPRSNRPAMAQRLGFGLEHELPGNMSVRADYVGILTHGLAESDPINTLPIRYYALGTLLQANIDSPQARAAGIRPPYPGFVGSVQQSLRPYPQYQSISYANSPTRFTNYQSLELRVQKRFGNGLNFLAGYTLSKSLWSASGPDPAYGRIKLLSPLDRPQSLTLSYTYELPFGSGKRFYSSSGALSRYLIGGWTITGSHSYFSGTPVRLSTWVNRVPGVALTTGVDRSNYDPNNPAFNSVLNIKAFQVAAPFTFGNTLVLPNFRTFGYLNENISLDKAIPIGERVRMRIAAQAFNIFNRVNFSTGSGPTAGAVTLGTDLAVPAQFGRYSAANTPRNVLLRARLEF